MVLLSEKCFTQIILHINCELYCFHEFIYKLLQYHTSQVMLYLGKEFYAPPGVLKIVMSNTDEICASS